MPEPAQIDLGRVYQGCTWNEVSIVVEDDGVPIDLTGKEVRTDFRVKVDSPTVLVTLSSDNGRHTVNTTDGRIYYNLGASVTATMPKGRFVFSTEVFDPNNADDVECVAIGVGYVIAEVTRTS